MTDSVSLSVVRLPSVMFCHAVLSVHCSLVVTCWEKGWPLCSPVCDVFLCFCHFPMWCPGSGVVLDCIDS